jgi:hypothetical protein
MAFGVRHGALLLSLGLEQYARWPIRVLHAVYWDQRHARRAGQTGFVQSDLAS